VKLGAPLTTVHREVNRLSQAGLINERRGGRTGVVSANPAGRYPRSLTEVPTLAFGPHVVIREEFADIPAAGVAIYGSWAARCQGVAGPPPAEVDVVRVADRRHRHPSLLGEE
jgi:hypothetical protein